MVNFQLWFALVLFRRVGPTFMRLLLDTTLTGVSTRFYMDGGCRGGCNDMLLLLSRRRLMMMYIIEGDMMRVLRYANIVVMMNARARIYRNCVNSAIHEAWSFGIDVLSRVFGI